MKILTCTLLLLLNVFLVEANENQQTATLKLSQLKIQASITSLLQYAASGDLNTLKSIVASGIDINSTEPHFGATALHNAAALGHLKMVKWLLHNHAAITAQDKQGQTALDWAIYHQQKEVEKYLQAQMIAHIHNSHQSSVKNTNKSATVLDYNLTGLANISIKIPQSSFHDWKQADTEAQSILSDWQTQAISIPWTKLQLQRYVKQKIRPGKSARGLALMHVAIYDALVLSQNSNQTETYDSQLSVSMAAAKVLAYVFPAEERAFVRTVYSLAAFKYKVPRDKLPAQAQQSLKLGQLIANRVIQHAQNDGAQRGWNGTRLQWYGEGRYYGPGSWEPTPPYFYYPPEEPYAPTWKTWFVKDGSQFRAPPLPRYGTDAFIQALKEVININKTLSPKQDQAAEFWVDGNGTATPAGHWNQIAIDNCQQAQFDDLKTARVFAELNTTLADTYITAWDSKYYYWSIRPVTAAQKLLGIKFKPAILTPPFPSYVSGHAATSGAASTILADYFPENATKLLKMGEAAAMSRLYGGIHYRFDNDQGLIQGRKVAQWVQTKFKQINEN
jgi:hypothetical protein